MFLPFNEMLSDLLAQRVIGSNVELELMFLLIAQSMCFILCSCVLPHIPTDGMERIFFRTPMPQQGIKLASVSSVAPL